MKPIELNDLPFLRARVCATQGHNPIHNTNQRQSFIFLINQTPGLFYANGVTLAPDESFVLVVETYAFQVTRLWLKGEKTNTADTLIGGIPGKL